MKGGFPGVSDCKESACNSGDLGSITGSGRSLREGKGYPVFLLAEFQGQRNLVGLVLQSMVLMLLLLLKYLSSSSYFVCLSLLINNSFIAFCCCCCYSLQSCPTLCDPIDGSPPGSLGFSRQEYWSGLPFPSPMHENEK